MNRFHWGLIIIFLVFTQIALADSEILKLSPFGEVKLFKSKNDALGIVILISDVAGWNEEMNQFSSALANNGYWVMGVDERTYMSSFNRAKSTTCYYSAADFENLSKHIQKKYKFREYLFPTLFGYKEGAALAFISATQAPENTFKAIISLNFCPSTKSHSVPCKGSDLKLSKDKNTQNIIFEPGKRVMPYFYVIQDRDYTLCHFQDVKKFISEIKQANWNETEVLKSKKYSISDWQTVADKTIGTIYAKTQTQSAVHAAVEDLPLVEVIPKSIKSDYFYVFMSGDGGWAGIDDSISKELMGFGVPVIGINSLKYFWKFKSAKTLASDLGRVISYYSNKLSIKNYKLIGFSFGADVIPFAYNELDSEYKKYNKGIALLGLSGSAEFEFHFEDWLSDSDSGYKTAPEIKKITDIKPLCIYGEEEKDSTCLMAGSNVNAVKVKGGHHFGGDYNKVAQIILGISPELKK